MLRPSSVKPAEDEVLELYGVALEAGAATKLDAGLVAGGDVSPK